MLPQEFIGLFILPVIIGLSNVAGIGGGGLMIPVFMSFWDFDTKQSIQLSGATIFVGSVVRYIYNINEKHPEKKATPIDYGIVIVMLPIVILGSFTGVLANIMLPEITITILLTIV